jgi:polyisoprenoid-binding protein YceI
MSWKVDYAHTHVGFSVRHMMLSTLRGQFEKYTISAEIDEDEIDKIHDAGVLTEDDVINSKLLVQIEAASINTREADRDKHLRSPDFLNAEKYPYVTFKATRGVKQDETHGRLIGDLTIRDVTKEVALDVEFLGQAKTPWGGSSVGFEGHTKIHRKDWGLTWNLSLETGGWLVGDEIRIDIEIEFTKAAEPVKQVAEPVKQVPELVTA